MDEITTMQPMRLTAKGLNLLAKAQAGAPLNITRAVIGEGYMIAGQTIENLTYVIKEVPSHQTGTDDTSATVDITCSKAVENGRTNIRIKIQNGDKTFDMREFGVMADDPDEGEIMYAYANLGDKARPLPASDGKSYISHDINLAVITSNASNVNVNISLPAEVSYKEFEDHRGADVLDHADNSVTYAKLAGDVTGKFTSLEQRLSSLSSSITSLRTELINKLTQHSTSSVIDHVNKSVTYAKLADDIISKFTSIEQRLSELEGSSFNALWMKIYRTSSSLGVCSNFDDYDYTYSDYEIDGETYNTGLLNTSASILPSSSGNPVFFCGFYIANYDEVAWVQSLLYDDGTIMARHKTLWDYQSGTINAPEYSSWSKTSSYESEARATFTKLAG